MHWARHRTELDKIPFLGKTLIPSRDLSEVGERKEDGENGPVLTEAGCCIPLLAEATGGDCMGSAKSPNFRYSVHLSGIITDLYFRKFPTVKAMGTKSY